MQTIFLLLLILGIILFILLITPFIFFILWNWLMPLFGITEITFLQSIGIVLLIHIIGAIFFGNRFKK